MEPFDQPPDILADLIRAELLCRPSEIRSAESRKTYLSHRPDDQHHEPEHALEAPDSDWTVMPLRPGEPIRFFGEGTYLLLRRATMPVPAVYVQESRNWRLVGKLGECDLPASFPSIEFPEGLEQIAVVPALGPPPQVGTAPWEPNFRFAPDAPSGSSHRL
jgi:hypothetical protein